MKNIIEFPIKEPMRVFAAAVSNKAYFQEIRDRLGSLNCQCVICQNQTSTTEI